MSPPSSEQPALLAHPPGPGAGGGGGEAVDTPLLPHRFLLNQGPCCHGQVTAPCLCHVFPPTEGPSLSPACSSKLMSSTAASGKPSIPTSPFSSLFPSHPEADHSTQPPELRCLPDPTNPRASPVPGTQEALRTLEGLWVRRTQLCPSKPSPLHSGTGHGQFFCFVFSTWGSQQRHKPRF